MKQHKNPDGTLNPFEMKGGPYEGWVQRLNEMECRARKSADTLQQMDVEDINGTTVATCVLSDLTHRLEQLLEEMEKYRTEAFK